MRIDAESLRSHYASISDEELLDLYRGQLSEVAQKLYDEEIARRDLSGAPEEAVYGGYEPAQDGVEELDLEPEEDGPPPAWLEDAACAWAAAMRRQDGGYAIGADTVRTALRAAGIPSHIVVKESVWEPPPTPTYSECCVMVPGELSLRAANVVELKVFNPQHEENWRNHLQTLSDEELGALKPEDFCGALLDRAARLKMAYLEEVASRGRERSGR